MPENETIRKQIVSIDVDTAARTRVRQHVKELKRDLADLRVSSAQLGASFADSNRQSVLMSKLTREVTRLKTETRGAADETKRLGDAEAAAGSVADRRRRESETRRGAQSLGRVETSVRGITGPVSMLGGAGIARPLNVGADLFGAAQGAKLLKQDLGELTGQLNLSRTSVAALAVGATAAAVTFLVARDAVNDWQESASQARQAVRGQIDALKNYYDFIGSATRDDLKSRLQEVAQKRRLNGQMLEDLMVLKNGVLAGLDVGDAGIRDQLGAGAVRAIDALGIMGFGLDELDDAISQTTTSMRAGEVEFDMLTRAYVENATAARDNALAVEQATKSRVDSLEQETKFILQAGQMNAKQIRDRQAQIRQETLWYSALQRDLTALAPTSEYAAQKLEEVTQMLASLGLEMSTLQGALPGATKTENQQTAADMLNNIIGMAKQGAGVISGAVAAVGDTAAESSRKLDQYRAHLAEVAEDRLRQSVREEADAALARTRAITDHYLDLAKLDEQTAERRAAILADMAKAVEESAQAEADINQDAEKERLDVLRDANHEALKAARAHQQRLLDIQSRTNLDIQKAELRLDAVAIWEAQKQGELELKQEKNQYDEDARQRDEDQRERLRAIKEQRQDRLRDLKEQRQDKLKAGREALADLQRQHDKERAESQRAFQAQLSREDQDRAIRRQRQEQDWAIQDQRYRAQNSLIESAASQHYGRMYGQAVTGMANVSSAVGSGMSNSYGRTVTGMGNVANAFSWGLSSIAAMVSSRLASISYTPSYNPGWSGRTTPTYAGGGTPPVGRDVVVGEHGWEVARFMQPARVYSHADSMQMMGGRSDSLDINLTVKGDMGDRSDAQLQALFKPWLKQVLTELKNRKN